MGIYVGYEPASSCTGGPQPGAQALMSWYLGAYAGQGGVNTGIYNCRNVRGGSTTSLHGEGRAGDLGIRPYGARYGDVLADRLRTNSAELGIQCVIWDREIWSGSYPHAGWRPYNGASPHVDHIHAELSWWAARNLTAERIEQVLGGAGGPVDKRGGVTWFDSEALMANVPVLQETYGYPDTGAKGRTHWYVLSVQQLCNIRALSSQLEVDGLFGPATTDMVRELQQRSGIAVDGIVGPDTWGWLLGNDAPAYA